MEFSGSQDSWSSHGAHMRLSKAEHDCAQLNCQYVSCVNLAHVRVHAFTPNT